MNEQVNDFKNLATHPYSLMLYFVLAGLTMIFLALSGAYLYTRFTTGAPPIKIPLIFLLNTGVLYSSSYTLKLAKKFYIADNTEGYRRTLIFTVLLTLAFMILQYIGWQQLKTDNPTIFKGSPMSEYVFAISVIHVFHILGGLPFFLIFLWNAFSKMRNPVTVLIYFADPMRQLQLRLLTLYWHFLDYLWIYLMVFFWGNYFIS